MLPLSPSMCNLPKKKTWEIQQQKIADFHIQYSKNPCIRTYNLIFILNPLFIRTYFNRFLFYKNEGRDENTEKKFSLAFSQLK